MSHTYLHVRNQPVKDIMDGLQFLHPVMDEEYLSSPAQFILYDVLEFIMIEKHNLGLYRNPVRRRRIYYREVACSQKRELEGSRYRGSCQGKSVH